MQLLTDDLRVQIPKLYSQEKVSMQEKTVYAKFFFPAADWTWFVTEGETEKDDYGVSVSFQKPLFKKPQIGEIVFDGQGTSFGTFKIIGKVLENLRHKSRKVLYAHFFDR